MKACSFGTSSALSLPVKSGMPVSCIGPLNRKRSRFGSTSGVEKPRFGMLPPRCTPGTPWQKAQLFTYSIVPSCTCALSYLHAAHQRALVALDELRHLRGAAEREREHRARADAVARALTRP